MSLMVDRRALRSEVLVVLALTAFAWAAYSGLRFVYDVFNTPISAPLTVRPEPEVFDAYRLASELIREAVKLVPVALVAHLLARSGGSMREMGFDLTRPRRDVASGSLLLAAALCGAWVLFWLGESLGLPLRPIVPTDPQGHPGFVVGLVVSAFVAGVAEEVILTGYLLTRLERLGWRPHRAALASAGLRAAGHLYQGWATALGHAIVGVIVARIFQRTQRVMPLVIAHALFNLVGFVGFRFLPDLVQRVL